MTRALVPALLALCACTVPEVDFTDRACPCDEGWVCDTARDLCIEGLFQDGLIAWYRLDDALDDGSAHDATLRGLDAACVGACPTRIEGRAGDAALFDGTARHLRVDDAPDLDTPDGLTVAAFVRIDRATRGAIVARSRTTSQPGATGWALELDGAGRAAFATWDGAAEHRLWSEIGSVRERAWAHVAGTWDGTTKRLWLEGAEVDEAAAALSVDEGAVLIGGDASTETLLPLDGAVDDVRIYGRALDRDELGALVAQ